MNGPATQSLWRGAGATRRAEWVAGVAWALSWFELYLEVYRYRHVAPTRWLRLPAPPLAVLLRNTDGVVPRSGWIPRCTPHGPT